MHCCNCGETKYRIVEQGPGTVNTIGYTTEIKQDIYNTLHEAMIAICNRGGYWDNYDRCWKSSDRTKRYTIEPVQCQCWMYT